MNQNWEMQLYPKETFINDIESIVGSDYVSDEDFVRYAYARNAWCCGAGGGVKAAFPDLAVEIATDRIEEAGAQVLTSACPFCLRNLRDASKMTKTAVQVTDVIELIQKVI